MTAAEAASRLSRTSGHGRPAAPVRLVHLGLGNFFRAHPCWYTEHAQDAAHWGFAAFTGRGNQQLVDRLNEQDGLYTLVSRGPEADEFEVLGSLSRVHAATDNDAWLRYLADPEVAAVTITVTEAGYLRRPGGGLDTDRPEVRADILTLRNDPRAPARTVPGRLLAGLLARQRSGAGPIALVPCDNLPGNGAITRRVVRELAELAAADMTPFLETSVTVASTMVDRITPGTTPGDARAVLAATGVEDRCPVVAEPFTEWVVSGRFPAGRPAWETAGATFAAEVEPYERRKLWLLNGAHSLLAYAGSIRGHDTVSAAIADETCRSWVTDWWTAASPYLDLPAAGLAAYRSALLQRFSNVRMADRLDRIAADGSQKLPVRFLAVLRAERRAGRLPAAVTRVLAAWICHLRGAGAPIEDARADEVVPLAAGPLVTAVPRVLAWLDPALGADSEVAALVIEQSLELRGST